MATITIKENEGHGRLEEMIRSPELLNIPVCRFKFPKFPLDKTKLVLGITKHMEDSVIRKRKKDLDEIIKFLIRQTYSKSPVYENDGWKKLKNESFYEFLYSAGVKMHTKVVTGTIKDWCESLIFYQSCYMEYIGTVFFCSWAFSCQKSLAA